MRVNTRLYINSRSGTFHVRALELCESWGGRPGLSVLMSLTVSVAVKQHWTVLRHWSQFVPNMSTDIRGHEALHHHLSCIWIFIHFTLLAVHKGVWLGQWMRTNPWSDELLCFSLLPSHSHPLQNVPLVEFMYLVFTRIPGESYRRRLRTLL